MSELNAGTVHISAQGVVCIGRILRALIAGLKTRIQANGMRMDGGVGRSVNDVMF